MYTIYIQLYLSIVLSRYGYECIPECQHPNGTCLKENHIEKDTGSCLQTTCKRETNDDGSFTMRVLIKPYACRLPSGFCLAPNKRDVDFEQCKKSFCKVTDGKYTVTYNYFGCPMNDTCQIPGTTVQGDCMNYKCKISNDKSRMQLKPLGKISCLMENGTCLDKGDTITDDVSCLQKECKLYKYSNNTVATGIIERFYGCPYAGRCEDIGTIKQDTQSCTTKKCRMFNNGLFMNWKIIDQGCSVGDGCRNHAERWNEDTDSMCVVKSCNVKAEGKNGYTWNTDIISHGCRSFNGTCYYNGDTWMDDGCFTKNCTVSETEDGGSSMKTDIVGGICKAVDGSCVEYGKEFLAQEGGPPCVCVEATSTDGYSIGQTSCPVPAL